MPLNIACPKCDNRLTVPDAAIGKMVRCKTCGTAFKAQAAEEPAPRKAGAPAKGPPPVPKPSKPKKPPADDHEDHDEPAPKPSKPKKPPADERKDDNEDDGAAEQPRAKKKKKKKKKKKSNGAMIAVIIVAAVLVLAGAGSAIAYFLGAFGSAKPVAAPAAGGSPAGRPAGGGPAGESKESKDGDNIRGVWESTSAFSDGENVGLRGLRVTFTNDKVTWNLNGKIIAEHTYKLDATKSPKAIDLTVLSNTSFKGKVGEGLYKLEGDTLTLCTPIHPGDRNRPTELKAEKNSMLSLFVLRRVKE